MTPPESSNNSDKGDSAIADVHINKVFVISMVIGVAIGIWGLIAPDQLEEVAVSTTDYAMTNLGWFFLLLCSGFVALSAYLAIGPYAHIKLGKDDEEPEFSLASWIAMLFAGGMGAGLLFWGVAEPVMHFHAPPGMEGGTAAAAQFAMVATCLNWGLHAWSIYGVCALVIAYFTFRWDKPSLISTPIRYAFGGDRYAPGINTVCNTADILGVLAVVFGLAGSLAMGVLQTRAGMSTVFGLPDSMTMSIIILLVLAAAFFTSASTGVDKGIKILSNLNMVVAVVIMLAVIFVGPTTFVLSTFVETLGNYFSSLIDISFRLMPYSGQGSWMTSWTLTFLIWWLAWGPFVGVFIARISRGRTIREFCIGVILIPTVFSILWFAAFGGASIFIEMNGPGGLGALVNQDTSTAIYAFFSFFPLSNVLNLMAIFLVFIFLVTSADSGTFVVSMMTTGGSLNPPTMHKLVWAIIITAITAGTLFSGSVDVAKSMAVVGAIPFSVILILQIIAFLKTIKLELKSPRREQVVVDTTEPRRPQE